MGISNERISILVLRYNNHQIQVVAQGQKVVVMLFDEEGIQTARLVGNTCRRSKEDVIAEKVRIAKNLIPHPPLKLSIDTAYKVMEKNIQIERDIQHAGNNNLRS